MESIGALKTLGSISRNSYNLSTYSIIIMYSAVKYIFFSIIIINLV